MGGVQVKKYHKFVLKFKGEVKNLSMTILYIKQMYACLKESESVHVAIYYISALVYRKANSSSSHR